MQWHELAGKWEEWKGHLRREWSKLSDDDLEHIQGDKEKLVGKVQQRYGMKKEEAQHKVDAWIDAL